MASSILFGVQLINVCLSLKSINGVQVKLKHVGESWEKPKMSQQRETRFF